MCPLNLGLVLLFVTYHIFRINILTTEMSLHPHCLFCLPLHVQPDYISHALFLDSPSSQASLEAKPPESLWFQVKGLEQQWV